MRTGPLRTAESPRRPRGARTQRRALFTPAHWVLAVQVLPRAQLTGGGVQWPVLGRTPQRRVRNERPEPRERPEHPARAIGAATIGSPHIIVLHTQRSKGHQELG